MLTQTPENSISKRGGTAVSVRSSGGCGCIGADSWVGEYEFETFKRALIKGEIDDGFHAWRLLDFADAVVVGSTEDAKAVDEVIRLERLRTQLRRVGLGAMVRHENVGQAISPKWTARLRKPVVQSCEDDFVRFG